MKAIKALNEGNLILRFWILIYYNNNVMIKYKNIYYYNKVRLL